MESSGNNDERKRTTERGSVDPRAVVANLESTITSLFSYLTSNSPPPAPDASGPSPRTLSDGEAVTSACSTASTPQEVGGSSPSGSLKSSRPLRLDLAGHRSPLLPPTHGHQSPGGGAFVSLADDAPPPLPRRGPPPFHLSSSSDLSSPSLEKSFCPSASSSATSPPPRFSLASRSSTRASPSPSGWAGEAPAGARDRKSVSRGSVASKASSDIELVNLGRGERGEAPWPLSPDAEERLRAVSRRNDASPRVPDRRNGMLVPAGPGVALGQESAPAPVGEQSEGRRTPEEYQAKVPTAPLVSGGGGGGRERGRGGSIENPRHPSKEDLAKMAASRLSLQASLHGGRFSHDHHYSEIDLYDVEGAPDGGEESTTRTASANTNSSATLPRPPPPVPPHTEGDVKTEMASLISHAVITRPTGDEDAALPLTSGAKSSRIEGILNHRLKEESQSGKRFCDGSVASGYFLNVGYSIIVSTHSRIGRVNAWAKECEEHAVTRYGLAPAASQKLQNKVTSNNRLLQGLMTWSAGLNVAEREEESSGPHHDPNELETARRQVVPARPERLESYIQDTERLC
ncbi:atherin-like [Penaeus indicus]|uniref:atherin-like n=1 Tax=Penaeus indicus TaxID=29960 RepID=UPI00300C28A0